MRDGFVPSTKLFDVSPNHGMPVVSRPTSLAFSKCLFEEFGVRPEEPVEPVLRCSLPNVVVEVVRAGSAGLVDVHVHEGIRAVLRECALQREVSEETDDGRERVSISGRITSEGDVRNGLFEQVVGDVLGNLHVVLLAELKKVFFSPVGELEAAHLAWLTSFHASVLSASIASSSRRGSLLLVSAYARQNVEFRGTSSTLLNPAICATSARPFK